MLKCKLTSKQVWKVVLILWIIIATLYVIYGEYNRLRIFVYNRGINDGMTAAVTRIMEESAKCQPLPLTSGENQVSIISIDCLNQPESEE